MKRDIREKRFELLIKHMKIKESISKIDNYEKAEKKRKEKEDIFNKYKFYDNLIKTMEEKK